jgi:hypothetical protein
MCVENNILCVLVILFMEASMIDIKPIWECLKYIKIIFFIF